MDEFLDFQGRKNVAFQTIGVVNINSVPKLIFSIYSSPHNIYTEYETERVYYIIAKYSFQHAWWI
jgi:hypothetical protein